MTEAFEALFAKMNTTYVIDSEKSPQANAALKEICEATNSLIQVDELAKHVMSMYAPHEASLKGGIRAAKAAGLTAENIRHSIRKTLGLDAVPQVTNQRISEIFEDVPSDPEKSVAKNVEQTLKTTTSSSRPSKSHLDDVVKLVAEAEKLATARAGGKAEEGEEQALIDPSDLNDAIVNMLRAATSQVVKQKNAKK